LRLQGWGEDSANQKRRQKRQSKSHKTHSQSPEVLDRLLIWNLSNSRVATVDQLLRRERRGSAKDNRAPVCGQKY
jgi:hypothetical protein